jgi:hypothetical protein
VLAQGLIRRIGDGATTEIWGHNWIPRESTMKPITSQQNTSPVMVKVLIDETSATWRESLIWESFLPVDASAILSIPLCT